MILLQLSSAQGPEECCLAVSKALHRLNKEADAAQVRLECLEQEPAQNLTRYAQCWSLSKVKVPKIWLSAGAALCCGYAKVPIGVIMVGKTGISALPALSRPILR